MKWYRLFTILMAVTLALFTGLSCSPDDEPSVLSEADDTPVSPVLQQGEEPAGATYVLGMSQCNLGEPWRVQMNADIAAAAEKHDNVSMIFKDAQNDTLKQRAHVEEFINRGVDCILISPKESAPLTQPVAKAYNAGIPVIVLDRALMGDEFTCFIGADNVMIGEAAGRWVAKTLNGKGRIVELKGLMTSVPAQDRHNGFMKGIAETDIETIFEADMKWLEPNARKEMESALARFDDIDLVYGHNDPAAHGAYLAAKAAGREDEMLFVGIDALPQEGQAYVRQGILDATFLYPTGGDEAIETALKILNGEEVPRQIVLGSQEFTQDNIDEGGRVILAGQFERAPEEDGSVTAEGMTTAE